MNLDNLVIPEDKKALLVIHEENMKEDDSGKCAYLETANHQRVLESDIKILEQYGMITISREEKESGIYIGNKNQIPEDANALRVVGETKNFHKYVAQYCKLNENIAVDKKKKKGSNLIFLFGI